MTVKNVSSKSSFFKDDLAILFAGDFRSFQKIAFDQVKRTINEHPMMADYLPHEISDRTAFAVVKKGLDNKKTSQGKIICIKAKGDDLGTWSWTNNELVDGFSLHKALPNSQMGHTSDPEGAIGLAKDGTLIVSSSATLFLSKINYDPHTVFENAKIEASSLEMRKRFDKFIARLGVKACSLSGSTFLVQPSESELINEYITALRKINVDSRFVFSLCVKMSENIEIYKESLVWQSKAFIEDLQQKLKDATRPRVSSLAESSDNMNTLLQLLKDFNISDDFIQSMVDVNNSLNKQLEVLKQKREEKLGYRNVQYLPLKHDFKLDIPCQVSLKKAFGRPLSFQVNKASYSVLSKTLSYEKQDGNTEMKDVNDLSSVLFKFFDVENEQVYLNETIINIEDNTYFDNRKFMPSKYKETQVPTQKNIELAEAILDIAEDLDGDEVSEEVESQEIVIAEKIDLTALVSDDEDSRLKVEEIQPEEIKVVEIQPEEIQPEEIVSEIKAQTLLEYVSSREAMGLSTRKVEALRKFSLDEISKAIDDGLISEFKSFLYTE
jgi:hypothetical protein